MRPYLLSGISGAVDESSTEEASEWPSASSKSRLKKCQLSRPACCLRKVVFLSCQARHHAAAFQNSRN